jgi:hypothetical protein
VDVQQESATKKIKGILTWAKTFLETFLAFLMEILDKQNVFFLR